MEQVIEAFESRKESLVLEGVHLRVTFMRKMMKKYPNLIPFVVCIKSSDKHKERFAVRSKRMTPDPRYNKYVSTALHAHPSA